MAIETEKKIIIIDEQDRNDIMRTNIEMDATANIIAKIISDNMNISTDRFKEYEAYYTKLYGDYKGLQDYIAEKYILSNPEISEKAIGWSLDYATCELTVDVEL